jgi:hypothetical protein
VPVGVLKRGNKFSPWFTYPKTGAVNIYLEASSYVDIFISNPAQLPSITSPEDAKQAGILSFPMRMVMNERFTLPEGWRLTGWNLTIGHSGAPNTPDEIAVYYYVSEA